jgi:hypothetical protein
VIGNVNAIELVIATEQRRENRSDVDGRIESRQSVPGHDLYPARLSEKPC